MTTTPPALERQIDHAHVVTVRQLLTQLQTPALKAKWPIARIAAAAGLPKSIVYRTMATGSCTLETLQAIARVFRGEVVIMIRRPAKR